MLYTNERALRPFSSAFLIPDSTKIILRKFLAACGTALLLAMFGALPLEAQFSPVPSVTWGGETFVAPSNGSGTTAMQYPTGVAVDASGNVYVADTHGLILKETPQPGGPYYLESVIFNDSSKSFSGVAVDSSGTLYVTDQENNVVLGLTPPTSPGVVLYTAETIISGLNYPLGIAVDSGKNLYIADACQNSKCTPRVLKETFSAGSYTQTTIADSQNGLVFPTSVALDASGDVYFGDDGPQAVFEATLLPGGGYSVGELLASPISPDAIAVDGNGNIFAAGRGINSNPVVQLNAPGQPTVALSYYPTGLAFDSSGYLYITDVELFQPGEWGTSFAPAVLKATLSGALNLGAEPVLTTNEYNAGLVTFFFQASETVVGAPPMLVSPGEFVPNGPLADACTSGTSYKAGSYCNVTVGFFPLYSGLRNSAVKLFDASGNVLANAYMYGTGLGPQMAFLPAGANEQASGLSSLLGIAASAYPGPVCMAQGSSVGCISTYSSPIVIGTNFTQAQGVAMDGALNVYVSDGGSIPAPTVWKMTAIMCSDPGCTTSFSQTQVAQHSDWNPAAIAVDISGNVYIGDAEYNLVWKETLQPDGTYSESTIPTSELGNLTGVAVDGSGNVYISDSVGNQVLKETPLPLGDSESIVANGYSSSYPLSQPNAVAVDGNGVVYIVDAGHDRVIMETPSGSAYTQSLIADSSWGLLSPVGVASDSAGHVYIADSNLEEVLEADLTYAPTVGFLSVADGSSSTTSVLVFNVGNQPLIAVSDPLSPVGPGLVFAGSSDFKQVAGGGTPPDCIAGPSFSLNQQTACNLAIQFAPVSGDSGPITGSVTLMDNNLDYFPYLIQTINLSGTATSGIKSTPVVTFGTAPTPIYLGGNFTVSASTTNTDSSVLTYSSVSGPCAWVSGATFSSSGAGNCVVQASGAATTNFQAASAQQTVSIGKATASVVLSAMTQTYTGAPLAPGASTTPTGLAVNWTGAPDNSVGSYPVTATINDSNYQGSANGTFVIQPATASVTLSALTQTYTGSPLYPTATTVPAGLSVAWTGAPDTKVGRYAVKVTVNNPNYTSNTASGNFVIQPAMPVINWTAPAPITYGTALGAAQLDATANTQGTFSYTPGAGTVLKAGTHTLDATFTPTDRTDYRTATASVTLTVSKAAPLITWATPAAIRYGTALSGTQLNARASVPGSFVYKPGNGTVLGVGNQTLKATFTPADSGDNYSATATVTITVNPALLTVTATNATARYNQPLPPLTYTVTGFANGDNKSVLSGAPSESTTAKQGSPPGTYPITINQGTLGAANYTFKFVNGTMTITH